MNGCENPCGILECKDNSRMSIESKHKHVKQVIKNNIYNDLLEVKAIIPIIYLQRC